MKENTKKTINLLCTIGIIVLLTIALLPPIIQLFLPGGDDYNAQVDLQLLTCYKELSDGSTKTIKTSYKNSNVQKVNINYKDITNATTIDEKDIYNLSGVKYNTTESDIDIEIIPNQNNRNRLFAMFLKIEKQKSVYEEGDYLFTCEITKQ